MLAERQKKTLNGEKQIERQLFSKTHTSHQYIVKGNNEVLHKTYAALMWETKNT